MQKVIVVFGYGPGISNAVAEKFGAEGFSVALVSRNQQRLDSAVQALKARGVDAAAFIADCTDPAAVTRAVEEVRGRFGSISAMEWTVYSSGAGDVTQATSEEFRSVLAPVVGLHAAIQAALPDLKKNSGAVLVTNGGLGLFDDAVDKMGVDWSAMGLSIANSAKHKLVRLLSTKLKPEGVYVGEVMVLSIIKGSAFDQGHGTLEASAVANQFWSLYTERNQTTAVVR